MWELWLPLSKFLAKPLRRDKSDRCSLGPHWSNNLGHCLNPTLTQLFRECVFIIMHSCSNSHNAQVHVLTIQIRKLVWLESRLNFCIKTGFLSSQFTKTWRGHSPICKDLYAHHVFGLMLSITSYLVKVRFSEMRRATTRRATNFYRTLLVLFYSLRATQKPVTFAYIVIAIALSRDARR